MDGPKESGLACEQSDIHIQQTVTKLGRVFRLFYFFDPKIERRVSNSTGFMKVGSDFQLVPRATQKLHPFFLTWGRFLQYKV
jgi:hypothetical protein